MSKKRSLFVQSMTAIEASFTLGYDKHSSKRQSEQPDHSWRVYSFAGKANLLDTAHNLCEYITELSEMLIVDKLLQSNDDVERKIIDGLLFWKTTEQIAEDCFLTVGGIKYRIKKIVSDSGATDKTQIINLLKKYIN